MHLVFLLLKFEPWEIFLPRGLVSSSLAFAFPRLFCCASSNLFSLACGPASASSLSFFFVFSMKTRIETDSFSERTPHLFAMQRRSIFGRAWKPGLEIYTSFLAHAEPWRQQRRRSNVSFYLVQNDPFSTFCRENPPKDCILVNK